MPHSMTPPTESPLALAASTMSRKPMGSSSPPISTMSVMISMPSFCSSCFTSPPAMQRATVMRPLNLPPPEISVSSPSFIMAVKSACPGLGIYFNSSYAEGSASVFSTSAFTTGFTTIPNSPPKFTTPSFQTTSSGSLRSVVYSAMSSFKADLLLKNSSSSL